MTTKAQHDASRRVLHTLPGELLVTSEAAFL